MTFPCLTPGASLAALALLAVAWADESLGLDQRLPDAEFFPALRLEMPELAAVRAAVEAADFPAARRMLADHFRTRHGRFWVFDAHQPSPEPKLGPPGVDLARRIMDRTGEFAAEYWLPNGELDWAPNFAHANWERMYFWQTLGAGYWQAGRDEAIARAWVGLLRSWVRQIPPDSVDRYWSTMTVGIRMRSGWPSAFNYFLLSPSFTPDDLVLFLKSTLEQTRHLRANHSATSNWLTFELAGLYCSGVCYPEFREAEDWRTHAVQVAFEDIERGYLPDGASIELCPGYHQFFSNYLHVADVAKAVGREGEGPLQELVARTEGPFGYYVKLMGPDRTMPAYNDNLALNVMPHLARASGLFPERQDFAWVATDGAEGAPPGYTSVYLPYAGQGAMRSGWERDANCLSFDFGLVGYRHAHQDKLNLVLWACGRQVLFDSGLGDYADNAFTNYARDTFAHNTVLVDSRPQRRKWYQHPRPEEMPYQPLTDVVWESSPAFDYAAGVFAGAYGLPGPSDSYPYKEGGNFSEGWSHPAAHHRRVLFLKPDLFVVADTLVARDGQPHAYDVRWHLDTTRTTRYAWGQVVSTSDAGQPNLELVPLLTDGLQVRVASGQTAPEVLGWNAGTANPRPATTVQHLKSGPATVQFVTVLLPLRPGTTRQVETRESLPGDLYRLRLADGRVLTVRAPRDPRRRLEASLGRR